MNQTPQGNGQKLCKYLTEVGSDFEESLLWFKLFALCLLRSLPLVPLLLVEVLRLLIVDELLKQLLIV